MEHTFVLYGNPKTKKSVRKGRYGNFYNPSAEDMEDYADRLLMQRTYTELLDCPIEAIFKIYMPIPKSFSRKKRAEYEERPCVERKFDFDNACKLICDSATGILYTDDKLIWKASQEKRYSSNPRVELIIIEEI